MKKYLVLGGNGFIGSHLVNKLAEIGNVRVFDYNTNNIKRNKSEIEVVQGDFRNCDFESLLDRIDVVFHLIGTTTPFDGTGKIEEEILSNILPTIHLLDAMVKKKTKKLIFASSGGTIYGDMIELSSERSALNPICSYGIQKQVIESYMMLYRRYHDLNAKVVRIANPYGTGQNVKRRQGAISVFMDLIVKDKVIEVWGDGSALRDYIHISDVIDALIAVEEYDGIENIFNVGTGIQYSVIDIIKEIGTSLNKEPTVIYKEKRLCDVEANRLDVSLIFKECGWKAKVSLDEGISMLIRNFNIIQ